MPRIEELFTIHNARSRAYENYDSGSIAFVTNGLRDNGVLGFVEPLTGDRVFDFLGIAVSTFCEATVQFPPFILRGNGGSGLVALEPKEEANASRLAAIAAYINGAMRWRFHWYRQATADRIRRLEIPLAATRPATFNVQGLLPRHHTPGTLKEEIGFRPFALGALYDLVPGEFHNVGDLEPGDTPVVSCADEDNGIIGFYDVPKESTFVSRLTVAFNGCPLTSKYHAYRFAAKDDVAVCIPKNDMRLTTHIYIQLALNRERWRYSYYRKCYADKLRRFQVLLPSKNGHMDEGIIREIIEAAPYWAFVKPHLSADSGF